MNSLEDLICEPMAQLGNALSDGQLCWLSEWEDRATAALSSSATEPPSRRVIQIAQSSVREPGSQYLETTTTALCDDGTVWEITDRHEWVQLPAVPQGAKP